jgi:hypothetical protein
MSDENKHWPTGKEVMQSGRCEHPKAESSFAAPTGSAYWDLFSHMSDNHGLTLLDSELEDICQVVERMRGWQPKEGKYTRWICANCGAPIGRKYRVKQKKLFWSHYMAKGTAGHCCNTPTPTPNK